MRNSDAAAEGDLENDVDQPVCLLVGGAFCLFQDLSKIPLSTWRGGALNK